LIECKYTTIPEEFQIIPLVNAHRYQEATFFWLIWYDSISILMLILFCRTVELSCRSVARDLPLFVTCGDSWARFAQFCKWRDTRYGRL